MASTSLRYFSRAKSLGPYHTQLANLILKLNIDREAIRQRERELLKFYNLTNKSKSLKTSTQPKLAPSIFIFKNRSHPINETDFGWLEGSTNG